MERCNNFHLYDDHYYGDKLEMFTSRTLSIMKSGVKQGNLGLPKGRTGTDWFINSQRPKHPSRREQIIKFDVEACVGPSTAASSTAFIVPRKYATVLSFTGTRAFVGFLFWLLSFSSLFVYRHKLFSWCVCGDPRGLWRLAIISTNFAHREWHSSPE